MLALRGCRKDLQITPDPSAKLQFSTDTLHFDTVFTTIGSSTRRLKIFNPQAQAVKVSSIQLAGGANSLFRLNLNGTSTIQLNDDQQAMLNGERGTANQMGMRLVLDMAAAAGAAATRWKSTGQVPRPFFEVSRDISFVEKCPLHRIKQGPKTPLNT